MPERDPIETVRSRFPSTPAEDAAELQEYGQHLARLRDQMRAEDLNGLEIAVTFDPRLDVLDG